MNLILRLAFANLNKNKNFTATLVLLSLLSALFLNIGLNMSAEMEPTFQICAERLNSPDFITVTSAAKYKTSFESFLENDARVDYLEKEEIIYIEKTKNSANTQQSGAVIFNSESERQIEPLRLLSEDPSISKDKAIYLPRTMRNSGASLGKEFTLTIKKTKYTFLVAGFFETSYMGTTGYAFTKYFVSDKYFQEMSQTVGIGKALSVKLQDGLPKNEISRELKKDFLNSTDYYSENAGLYSSATCLSYDELEDSIMSLFSVPTIIMIAMAFIIGIITIVIVYFKVKEGIDNNLVNIGCLQAIGYTTKQILFSEISEYTITGAIGGFAGIVLSYAAMPIALSYGEGIIGIAIQSGTHINLNLLSLCIVTALMFLSTLLAAWKIKKISPVTALRKGIKEHHFGQNFFPLSSGTQGIHLRLALKHMTSNFRQNITTIIIIALGVFAVNLSVVLYSNFGNDNSAVTKMTGLEVTDIQIQTQPHANKLLLQKNIESMEEVRKTNMTDSHMLKIGDDDVHFVTSNDFSKTETLTLSQGDFPQYDNEVVLTSTLMKKLSKKIGDSVDITAKGTTRDYMIVGIYLGTNSGGKMGLISLSGLQRMDPYYDLSQIDVYLKDPSITKDFMEKLYSTYGVVSSGKEETGGSSQSKYDSAKKKAEDEIRRLLEQYHVNSVDYAVMLDGKVILSGNSSAYQIKEISSLTEYLEGQLESYTLMMNGLMAVIFIVMLIVVGSILFITVHSLIHRQKEEFGIYKSMGYTTHDLVKIIRLTFVVNAVIGSILGGIFCMFNANKILRLFFINMGLDLANFDISIFFIILVGFITVLYVWILTTIKAYQVRKISVYEFLTE